MLVPTGEAWICAACLTEQTYGSSLTDKLTEVTLRCEAARVSAKRMRAAGCIESAVESEIEARLEGTKAVAVRNHANRVAQATPIIQGEALPPIGTLRETLADPDLVAIESSYTRGSLLQANNALALGVDVSNTANASNTHEKLIAHQIAVAHKVALEQTRAANNCPDSATEIKRLQVAARM